MKSITEFDFTIIDNVNENDNKIVKNNCITFDFDDFINEILKSYQYDSNKILEQLSVDLPRTHLYYKTIYDSFFGSYKWTYHISTVQDYFTHFTAFDEILYKNYNFMTIFAALCTQSAYYYQYLTIYKIDKVLKNKNYILTTYSHNLIFDNTTNDMEITLNAIFNIKYIPSNKIIKIYESQIKINVYNGIINQLCVMTWNIIKN